MNNVTKGTAVVTGASSGIGAAFADQLAAKRYDLLLVARRRERLEEKAEKLGGQYGINVEILVADLSVPEGLGIAADRIKAVEPLAMLVNNAGVGGLGPFADMAEPDIHTMINVNVTAVTVLTRAALPVMLEAGAGTIINVSSGAAFARLAGAAVYAATKAFVAHFTENLHEEVASRGIRLQALVPGLTRTEFAPEEEGDSFYDRFPPDMIMEPEDLVSASLKGLELGELVCIPSLENGQEWEETSALLQKVGSSSKSAPAARYR